jgi:hypothetical protein
VSSAVSPLSSERIRRARAPLHPAADPVGVASVAGTTMEGAASTSSGGGSGGWCRRQRVFVLLLVADCGLWWRAVGCGEGGGGQW